MESHFCWLLLPRETKPLIKKLSSLKSTFDVVAREQKKKLCLVSKNITVSNNDNIRVGVEKNLFNNFSYVSGSLWLQHQIL